MGTTSATHEIRTEPNRLYTILTGIPGFTADVQVLLTTDGGTILHEHTATNPALLVHSVGCQEGAALSVTYLYADPVDDRDMPLYIGREITV